MTSRLGAYAPGEPAEASRALKAAALDLLVAAIVGLLLWPFPLIRLTLAVPVAAHTALIVVWILVVYLVYMTASVAAWGRTPAMYLLDLGLRGRPRPFGLGTAARWAAGWVVTVLPALLGARGLADPRSGLPARLSGVETVVSVPPSPG